MLQPEHTSDKNCLAQCEWTVTVRYTLRLASSYNTSSAGWRWSQQAVLPIILLDQETDKGDERNLLHLDLYCSKFHTHMMHIGVSVVLCSIPETISVKVNCTKWVHSVQVFGRRIALQDIYDFGRHLSSTRELGVMEKWDCNSSMSSSSWPWS